MKTHCYFRNCRKRFSPVTMLGIGLVIIAGCVPTPESGTVKTAEAPGDSVVAADKNEAGEDPVAQSPDSSPQTPITKSGKPLVDVSTFMDAALNGDIETVRRAVESGVNVDVPDPQRCTALMWASFNGHTAVAKLLLAKGAAVLHRDAVGRTPLMFAASGANEQTVKLLLDSGADIDVVDSGEGFTALMHAAAEGQVKVVQLLLKHNADRNIRDVDGDTARDFAGRNGHIEVVRMLSK